MPAAASTAAAGADMPSLLVLGGTAFVGRAAVDDALARGWSVATLNRGRSGADRPEVEALHADRDDPASVRAALAGRAYDLVLDVSGLNAARVAATADALAGSCGRYGYVSTAGVYAEWPERDGLDETGALVEADPDDPSPPSMERYSEQKRGGELAAVRAFGPDRTLLVRPGVIYGPYENVRRCAYWLGRAAAGGPVLVGGRARPAVPGGRRARPRGLDARRPGAGAGRRLHRGVAARARHLGRLDRGVRRRDRRGRRAGVGRRRLAAGAGRRAVVGAADLVPRRRAPAGDRADRGRGVHRAPARRHRARRLGGAARRSRRAAARVVPPRGPRPGDGA